MANSELPVRYVKFRLDGFDDMIHQGLFIPTSVPFNEKFVSTLVTNLHLKKPNLLLRTCSPGIHPYHFQIDEELEVPDFDALRAEALRLAGGEEGKNDQMRRLLAQKQKDVIKGVMSAIEMTESWTIKQCSTSDSYEVLSFAAAKERGGFSAMGIGAMHVNDACIAPGGKTHSMLQRLWRLSRNFDEACQDSWQDKEAVKLDGAWLTGKESGRLIDEPYPGHSNAYGSGLKKPEDRKSISQWVNPSFPVQCFFYERLEDTGDLDLVTPSPGFWINPIKDMTVIGPLGWLFVSGRTKYMKDMMMKVIDEALPCVLLNKTGGYVNVLCDMIIILQDLLAGNETLRRELNSSERGGASSGHGTSDCLNGVSVSRLFQKAVATSGVVLDQLPDISLADAQVLLDFAQQRPEVLTNTIKVINPLTDTPESAVDKVAGAFASTYKGVLELGASEAYRQTLKQAWALHMDLHARAKAMKVFAMSLAYASAIVDWLVVVLAATAMCYDEDDSISGDTWALPVLMFCVVLSGSCYVLQSRLYLLEKWGTLKYAHADVMSEIYLFRSQAGRYLSTTGNDSATDRKAFLDRLCAIRAVALGSTSLGSTSADGAEGEPSAWESKADLEDYVIQAHISKIMDITFKRSSVGRGAVGQRLDDGFAQLSEDRYVEVRLTPLWDMMVRDSRTLQLRRLVADVAICSVAVAAIVLLFHTLYLAFIMVASLAVVVGRVRETHRWSFRLRVTERVVGRLAVQLKAHEVANQVDRQKPLHKSRLVKACEMLNLDLVNTSGSATFKTLEDDYDVVSEDGVRECLTQKFR